MFENNIGAADKFYYCPGCKKFHEFGAVEHNAVNRKLCFYCGKIQSAKTKIIGDDEQGRSQICPTCHKHLRGY